SREHDSGCRLRQLEGDNQFCRASFRAGSGHEALTIRREAGGSVVPPELLVAIIGILPSRALSGSVPQAHCVDGAGGDSVAVGTAINRQDWCGVTFGPSLLELASRYPTPPSAGRRSRTRADRRQRI